MRLSSTLMIAAVLLAGPAIGPVAAQEEERESQRTAPSVEQISDSRLEQIVTAYLEVFEIQNEVQAQIEGSDTPEEARRHQERANQRILGTLDAMGITPEDYSVVMRAVEGSPDFRERFVAMMEKVQREQQEQEQSEEG